MMTEEEYREMYAEYAMESGSRMEDTILCPAEGGFEEFKAWRKRVEKLFDNMKDSS